VGLFDEDYYIASQEDAELGVRLRLAGYDIIVVPTSHVYHKYKFSRADKLALLERSRPLLLFKILQKRTLLFILPAFLLVELAVLIYALKQGWLREKLYSYIYLFKNWRHILEGRRRIRRIRKWGDGVLLPWLKGGIYFQEIGTPALTYVLNPFLEAYWWLTKRALWLVGVR
jgi:GT2 family glycosyltransferase